MNLRHYQLDAANAALDWIRKCTDPCVVGAPTGCHAKGSQILMSDGTIKAVESIVVGDIVMGPDGQGRRVLDLHRGTDEMYAITPKKGDSFVVNGGHILSLKSTNENKKYSENDGTQIVNISVYDYIKKSKYWKHVHKLYRSNAIEFKNKDLPMPPYIIGLLLGDGSLGHGRVGLTTFDAEIKDEWIDYIQSIDGGACSINQNQRKTCPTYYAKTLGDHSHHGGATSKKGKFQALARLAGIFGMKSESKSIPVPYKTSSINDRLELLAGLMDSDGSLSNGVFYYISKSNELSSDVAYIARSLGFAAYVSECMKSCQKGHIGIYYRVSISGDVHLIPTRLPRKRASTRKQKKRVTVTGFNVESVGFGEYYGFTVDVDHLYLMGDFTVTHNSGKSFIIAHIAEEIRKMSGKNVLVIAPSGELVTQDYNKYLLTGNPASIFSASGGRKETRYPVVFGSPLTVANNLTRFDRRYAAVIIDEAHGITPTLISIIDHMRNCNPNLRIIGLSATPYRLGTGYIYAHHFEQGRLGEDAAREPYFHTLVYDIDARLLIDEGFLTPPVMEDGDTHYDTSGLVMLASGRWDAGSVDAAFEGHGRKTAGIVADIVARSKNRKGVMIFAATIRHAEEVMASLNPEISALITSKTPKGERAKILESFIDQELKYLVNVSVLTTGFDAPHIDGIGILRATESVALLQQIIGRGLRIFPEKNDCQVWDYAENIERHCPGGDVFDPVIKTSGKPGEAEPIESVCPECHYHNFFSARPNPDCLDIDSNGYFRDPLGERIKTDHGDMPAHYGRRCLGESMVGGRHTRCGYQWTHKECHECGHKNDIAARHCTKCKAEIVDPNEKLKEIAAKIAKDPYRTREANVLNWSMERWPGKGEKPPTLRVRYQVDEPPRELSQWLSPESQSAWMRSKWHQFCQDRWGEDLPDIQAAIDQFDDANMPKRIIYRKNKGSKFFDVISIGD